MRIATTVVASALALTTAAQSWLGASSFFGRQADARSEAMGRGNVALRGDVRNMGFNPAGLMDLRGLDLYMHSASKWYVYEKSAFEQMAIACRFAERFALGVAVDGSTVRSDQFSFGDQIDPRRGFIYNSGDGFLAPTPRMTVSLAAAPLEHLHVGAALGNIPLDAEDQDVVYGSFGFAHGGDLKTKGPFRHAFRVAASTQNITFAEETNAAYRLDLHGQVDSVFSVTDRIPAIFRGGFGYTLAWDVHSLRDTLSPAALTLHIQYDDDLTQRYRSAVHIGGELLLYGVLAMRGGWYRESVDDGGNALNANELQQFTYGVGLVLPFDAITKGSVPITINFDYTNLPQVSYSANGLGIGDQPWENFQSIGLRLNYAFSPLIRKRVRT